MERVNPVIVKLGGSVVTDKKTPFSYREKVVRTLGRTMASSGLSMVLVHGGGSFGHPVAKKFGLSSHRSSRSPTGVSETRGAMFELNAKICASLVAGGMHPYTFSPFTLLEPEDGLPFIARLLGAGVTPVTFGDVVNDGGGFRILSGDTICVRLAEMLASPLCVLCLDVDGLLDEDGAVIKELHEGEELRALHGEAADATGGISFKLSEARRMASSGTEVRLVSGFRPREFHKALKGLSFRGTTIKGTPR